MIKGTVTLEEVTVTFTEDAGQVSYEVTDASGQVSEKLKVPADKFFKALAITVNFRISRRG